jgi:CubicO group peptidase (beta-lactamase class C family)
MNHLQAQGAWSSSQGGLLTRRGWLAWCGASCLPAWAQGTAPRLPADLAQRIASTYYDVSSLVVLHERQTVFEHYSRDAGPETLWDIQSVTKSVLSTLIGVALQDGKLPALNAPLVTLIPDAAEMIRDERARAVTLRHVLTFTAGFEPESFSDRWARRLGGADTLRRALSRPLVAAPGASFSYDNTTAYLASAALRHAVGMPASQYAQATLFRSLGISQYTWPLDAAGNNPAHAGLHLCTRDMAKIGELLLNNSMHDGKAVLSAEYAMAAGAPQSSGGPPVPQWRYGLMWWVVPSNAPRAPFLASGLGGQFIYVDPSSKTVLAVTSHPSQASNKRGHALQLIQELLGS